jgi:hypothetical protein
MKMGWGVLQVMMWLRARPPQSSLLLRQELNSRGYQLSGFAS